MLDGDPRAKVFQNARERDSWSSKTRRGYKKVIQRSLRRVLDVFVLRTRINVDGAGLQSNSFGIGGLLASKEECIRLFSGTEQVV